MTAKPPNKFAAWQEATQVRREAIINEYLDTLSKTRVKVRNLTDLAELVARHITQIEGAPCNKSTLLRNLRYKTKLLTYLTKSLEPGFKALKSRVVTDPRANALVTSAQLESGNLKRELERLNIYATSLEEQVDQLKSEGRRLSSTVNTDESPTKLLDYEFRFVRTCQALISLISHLNMIVQVDPKNQCILDMSKRRNNIIVDKEVAGPFFEWLASQGGLISKSRIKFDGGSTL